MKTRMLWMWVLVLIVGVMAGSLGEAIAVTPAHTGPTDYGPPLSRPRAPQSVEIASRGLPPLSVVEFLTVVGGAPAASFGSVTPKSDTERTQWESDLTQWRKDQQTLLGRVRALLPDRSAQLSNDAKGALITLKGEIEGWQNRDSRADWGNQVFSKEALAVAQETAALLVDYSEAYAQEADPGQSRAEKEHRAFEAALKAQPEARLTRPSKGTLDSLSAHHRTQVKSLLALRDFLRSSGNMEEFAASLRKDTRPTRQLDSVAQR